MGSISSSYSCILYFFYVISAELSYNLAIFSPYTDGVHPSILRLELSILIKRDLRGWYTIYTLSVISSSIIITG